MPKSALLGTYTLTWARLYAFNPCAIKFVIDFICTLPEPSAATPAATGFAGLETAAFGTSRGHRSGNRRLGDFCSGFKNMQQL